MYHVLTSSGDHAAALEYIAVHSIALHCTVYISSIVCVCYSGDHTAALEYNIAVHTQHCTAVYTYTHLYYSEA